MCERFVGVRLLGFRLSIDESSRSYEARSARSILARTGQDLRPGSGLGLRSRGAVASGAQPALVRLAGVGNVLLQRSEKARRIRADDKSDGLQRDGLLATSSLGVKLRSRSLSPSAPPDLGRLIGGLGFDGSTPCIPYS